VFVIKIFFINFDFKAHNLSPNRNLLFKRSDYKNSTNKINKTNANV
jgi:hypothetical protein